MLIASVFRTFWRRLGLAGLALLAPALFGQSAAPVVDGFDPNVDGIVYALAMQPNGQIIAAGSFTSLWPANSTGPTDVFNITRINVDGSVDTSFRPSVNGQISAIALQADGKIVIVGKFTAVGGTTRNRVARLNADGTLDTVFNPNTGGSLTPQVNAVVIQTNGKIIIGGGFTTVQPNGAATATARNRLARFNADGTLDTAFNPNANGPVQALALQRDGAILVGGGFTKLLPNGATTLITRNYIARLATDGTVDKDFDPNCNNIVNSIAVHPSGKIAIGGNFTTVRPIGATDPISRVYLASIFPDGSVDGNFVAGANSYVTTVAFQPDGRLLVGGSFTTLRANNATVVSGRNFVGRFTPDGSLDATFNPNVNYTVYAFAVQTDGRIVMGGNFSTISPNLQSFPVTRNHLARVNADGTLDATFEPDATGRPRSIAVQADGKILIAGTFTSVAGITRNGLARLNIDGTVDPVFDPQCNFPVSVVFVQADKKIIIGGIFTTLQPKGVGTVYRRNYLARLNEDGTVDTAFNPDPNGQIISVAQQADGALIIGGVFSAISRHNAVDPITTDTDTDYRNRNNIARLNLDGTLDDNFNPSANGTVAAISVQSDGQILIAGTFSLLQPNGSFFSVTQLAISRLNKDGTIANSLFNPAPNGAINSFAVQSDGKIIIAGVFNSVSLHNNTDPNLRDTDDDRRTRNHLARLNVDGTLDQTYDPNINNIVNSIALQADGKLLVGGIFTTVQPNGGAIVPRRYFARINSDGTVDAGYNLGLNERTDTIVNSLLIQPDGKAILVGSFTSLQPGLAGAPIVRNHIARVTANAVATPTVDSFNPGVSGSPAALINAVAIQSDGKIIVGGKFSSYGGNNSSGLARFLPDSTPDSSFTAAVDDTVNAILAAPTGEPVATQSIGFGWLKADGSLLPGINGDAVNRIAGQVNAVAVQADGKLLVGGGFVTSTTTTGSVAGSNLVRYKTDGTLDTTFKPDPNGIIQAIAVQPADGKIIVVGAFDAIAGVTGTTHKYIARLNPDGSLDAAFDPQASGQVSAVVLQPDGKILIAGFFDNLSPGGVATTPGRSYIARLSAAGVVEKAFDPGVNFQVITLALQADKKILLGGYFTTLKPNGATTSTARSHIARINEDASLDTTFDPNCNGIVTSIAVQADRKILLGGNFTTVQPNAAATTTARTGLARVNADGSLDTDFDPNPNGTVNTIAVRPQPDGRILIGGGFTSLKPPNAVRSIARNHLALINPNGSVDSTFNPNANGLISVVFSRADGSILIGGTFDGLQPSGALIIGGKFTKVNDVDTVPNLALLNTDGTTNTSFVPNPNDAVYALMYTIDGRTVVGGAFTAISGATRTRLARFKSDNTLDPAFAPVITGPVGPVPDVSAVFAVAQQGDGRMLIGGSFTNVGGAPHGYLARVNVDGTVDPAYNPSVPGAVSSILVQSDGKILVTTNTAATGPAVNQLRRLNADGTADATFSVASNGSVNGVALRSDGLIYAGGSFTTIGGASVSRLARLSATGAVDATFNPAPDAAVNSLVLQSDGKLIAGGLFTQVGGLPRQGLVRLSSATPATDIITVDSDLRAINLVRGGSAPQLGDATFDYSIDGRNWYNLGTVTRDGATGNWRISGLDLPPLTVFSIRVRETSPSSQNTSSSLFFRATQFYLIPVPDFTSPTAVNAAVNTAFFYVVSARNTPTSFSAAGLPAGLTIDTASGIISGTPTQAGTYSVTLGATNTVGTATTTLALFVAASAGTPDSRLINISSRTWVDDNSTAIAGFVISGTTEPRSVLLRAVGPSLSNYGVTAPLATPTLRLVSQATARTMLENSTWADSAQLLTAFNRLGAFPLTAGSADAAVIVTLPPGAYTMLVTNKPSASTATGPGNAGIVLAEVYDANGSLTTGASRLINISTRGTITNSANLIGGFVVNGTAAKRILIRGIGPALASYGVTGALSDPVIFLRQKQGVTDIPLAQNNDWGTPVPFSSSYLPATAAELAAAATSTGAFALADGSKDAAILVTLAPGIYTAEVGGAGGITGNAMVEVYEVPVP